MTINPEETEASSSLHPELHGAILDALLASLVTSRERLCDAFDIPRDEQDWAQWLIDHYAPPVRETLPYWATDRIAALVLERDRWFQEWLGKHDALLDEIRMIERRLPPEPNHE